MQSWAVRRPCSITLIKSLIRKKMITSNSSSGQKETHTGFKSDILSVQLSFYFNSHSKMYYQMRLFLHQWTINEIRQHFPGEPCTSLFRDAKARQLPFLPGVSGYSSVFCTPRMAIQSGLRLKCHLRYFYFDRTLAIPCKHISVACFWETITGMQLTKIRFQIKAEVHALTQNHWTLLTQLLRFFPRMSSKPSKCINLYIIFDRSRVLRRTKQTCNGEPTRKTLWKSLAYGASSFMWH